MSATYETELNTKLLADALAGYDAVKQAVAAVASARKALDACPADITLRLASVDTLSLAAEHLSAVAEALHKEADAALVAAMEGSGATAIAHDGITVALRKSPGRLEIVDETAVPEMFWTKPAPRPDAILIKRHLKGNPENWARVVEGPMSLARKAAG